VGGEAAEGELGAGVAAAAAAHEDNLAVGLHEDAVGAAAGVRGGDAVGAERGVEDPVRIVAGHGELGIGADLDIAAGEDSAVRLEGEGPDLAVRAPRAWLGL